MNKLTDMGHKDKDMGEPAIATQENKTRYPSINLYDKVPSDLMGKEVGDTCRIEIVGKITSKGIDEGGKGKRETMNIEIHKMGYLGKGGKATKDEYLKMDKEDRESYDKEDKGI